MYRIYCDHNASLELVIERNILLYLIKRAIGKKRKKCNACLKKKINNPVLVLPANSIHF